MFDWESKEKPSKIVYRQVWLTEKAVIFELGAFSFDMFLKLFEWKYLFLTVACCVLYLNFIPENFCNLNMLKCSKATLIFALWAFIFVDLLAFETQHFLAMSAFHLLKWYKLATCTFHGLKKVLIWLIRMFFPLLQIVSNLDLTWMKLRPKQSPREPVLLKNLCKISFRDLQVKSLGRV